MENTLSSQFLSGENALSASRENNSTFLNLKSKLPQLEIEGNTFYVCEGDLLKDEDELFVYALEMEVQQVQNQLANAEMGTSNFELTSAKLVGIVSRGKIVRWKPGKVLKYAVLRNTFRTQEQYEWVKQNMRMATEQWEAICGVNFEHVEHLDSSASLNLTHEVTFIVRELDSGGLLLPPHFFLPRQLQGEEFISTQATTKHPSIQLEF
ncbi:hypothetical protein KFE98_17665 [bacterium SCSIO 12741]|nr:hypothetical protein KFE98_17665 [bacterium SCSIO 12741]